MSSLKTTRGAHIFWGHICIALTFSLLGLWTATQYCAWALNYQPQLGPTLFIIQDHSIYEPWAWLFWAYHFEPYAPEVFQRASWIMYGTFGVMFLIMVLLAIYRGRQRKNEVGAYGTARWATTQELKQMALLENSGVVLAQTQDACFQSQVIEKTKAFELTWQMTKPGQQILCHSGPEHIFCFAPTRSGKGVGLVIPTLLSWTGSALIYDIKKELWRTTAGFRLQFSHCLRFEPTDPNSVRFNPLLEIRPGDYEVRDVQNVADILVDPEGKGDHRDHWAKTGHALLVGTILHVLYAEPDKSLRGVANFLANPARSIYETLNHMLSYPHLENKTHPVVASTAREMLNKSDNELSGVLSTAMSFLGLYRDPIIARNTEASDFKINDLMQAAHPVSLYLVVPPSDIDRTKPLIRLMLNQMGRRLTEKMAVGTDQHYNHRLLMLLDEFPSLGNLNFFETELAYLAGYGIKCFMIAQSLNQIEKAYGPNNSILDNSHIRVTYAALDDRTAERISKLLGQATEKRRQLNFAGNRLAPWLGHIMASEQESPRPLLTPGEILQLPGDEALVMVGGMPPYRAKKIMYYQDPRFQSRAWLPPPDSKTAQQAELFNAPKSPWLNLPTATATKANPITPPPNNESYKDNHTEHNSTEHDWMTALNNTPQSKIVSDHTTHSELTITQTPNHQNTRDRSIALPESEKPNTELQSQQNKAKQCATTRQTQQIITENQKQQQKNRNIELTREPLGGDFPL